MWLFMFEINVCVCVYVCIGCYCLGMATEIKAKKCSTNNGIVDIEKVT